MNSLAPAGAAELGVGAVSFFVGLLVGGASFLGLSGRGAVMLSVAGYAIHSHFGLNLLSNMSLPSLPNWNFPVPPSTTNS